MKRSSLRLAAGAVSVCAVMTLFPAVVSASAATAWTVLPGGSVTASAGATVLKDTGTGKALQCSASAATASLVSGSGLTGSDIGTLTVSPFSGCLWTGGVHAAATPTGLPWVMSVTSYSNGVATAVITGVHIHLSGPSCTAEIDGTSATADDGTLTAAYTNDTGVLQILATRGNLHVYDASGCGTLTKSGDALTATAGYSLTPRQTIAFSSSWSISPGGSFSGTGSKPTLKDTTLGTPVSCTSSSIKGTLTRGSGLAGANEGTITAFTLQGCTWVAGGDFTVSSGDFPWKVSLLGYDKDVSTAIIKGIHVALMATTCEAVIDGTSATAGNGAMEITYTNSGKLKTLSTGGNLHVYPVNKTCLGLFGNGHDAITIDANYTITPTQTITAPVG